MTDIKRDPIHISDIINLLEDLRKEHGDMEVVYFNIDYSDKGVPHEIVYDEMVEMSWEDFAEMVENELYADEWYDGVNDAPYDDIFM